MAPSARTARRNGQSTSSVSASSGWTWTRDATRGSGERRFGGLNVASERAARTFGRSESAFPVPTHESVLTATPENRFQASRVQWTRSNISKSAYMSTCRHLRCKSRASKAICASNSPVSARLYLCSISLTARKLHDYVPITSQSRRSSVSTTLRQIPRSYPHFSSVGGGPIGSLIAYQLARFGCNPYLMGPCVCVHRTACLRPSRARGKKSYALLRTGNYHVASYH